MTDLDARADEAAPTLFSAGSWGAPVAPKRRRAGFAGGLVVGLVVAGALGGAFLLGRSSGTGAVTPPPTVEPAPAAVGEAVPPSTPASTAVAPTGAPAAGPVPSVAEPPVAAPAADVAVAPTTVAPSPPAATGLTLPPADPALPVVPRSALYAAGTVHLRGSVPEVAVAEAIVAKVAAVVGPDHVSVEYALDPRAVVDQRVPLQVADTVLFEPGSATVTPDFLPLLDLGAALLTQNPSVTMTILGHTDSQGSAEANLLLSKQRVDAVAAQLAARGVDPVQLVPVPMGADAPLADNTTEEGRRVNRRVEFRVSGLLDA